MLTWGFWTLLFDCFLMYWTLSFVGGGFFFLVSHFVNVSTQDQQRNSSLKKPGKIDHWESSHDFFELVTGITTDE